MPSLQNKTYTVYTVHSVECRNLSTTKFRKRKHIGGYRDVKKLLFKIFNQEAQGKNIGKQECSAENEVQLEL